MWGSNHLLSIVSWNLITDYVSEGIGMTPYHPRKQGEPGSLQKWWFMTPPIAKSRHFRRLSFFCGFNCWVQWNRSWDVRFPCGFATSWPNISFSSQLFILWKVFIPLNSYITLVMPCLEAVPSTELTHSTLQGGYGMSIYKCCLPNKGRHVFGREKVTPWKGRTMKGAVFGTDQHVVVNLQGLIWYRY